MPDVCGGILAGDANALAYAHGDGSFALNVRRTTATDDRGASIFSYSVFSDGSLITDGQDISGWGDALEALSTLASFLGADAESYARHMGMSEPEDGYAFGPIVAEWAYMIGDELAMLAADLGDAE